MKFHVKPYVLSVYRDRQRKFRWRIVAPNGNIIADGSQGYSRRTDAMRAGRRLRTIMVVHSFIFRYE